MLLRIQGHFGASASTVTDRWSTGLRLAQVGGTDVPDGPYTSFLESIATPISAFHAHSDSNVGTRCWLDELTCAKIGFDGKYYDKQARTEIRPYGSPVAGQGIGTSPWTTTLVTSLRTVATRGYASNGRMYYPATGLSGVQQDGRVASAVVQARLDRFKIMFDAINAAAETQSTGLRIHVLSAVGAGMSLMVTSLRADGRIDSIERRENDLPVVYSTVTLA